MHDFNGTADRKIELSVSAPLIDGDFGKSVRVSYQKAMRVAHLVIGDGDLCPSVNGRQGSGPREPTPRASGLVHQFGLHDFPRVRRA